MEEAKDAESAACRFDDAVCEFIACVAQRVPVRSTDEVARKLQSLFDELKTTERQTKFIQALLKGKREMSLDPLVTLFNGGTALPPDGDAHRQMEDKILDVDWELLVTRMNAHR